MLPVVSFIGTSGAGKSRLIRFFVNNDFPKPIPGNPKSINSTSADVHSYIGDFLESSPSLIFDSEGSDGTVVPRAAEHRWNEALAAKRGSFIHTAYPRLLYMFSDVLCYVADGSKRKYSKIIKLLATYGKISAAGTVNQNRLPTLILVFNKLGEEEGTWNVDHASADFNANPILQLYFRDIRVVGIFNICINYERCENDSRNIFPTRVTSNNSWNK